MNLKEIRAILQPYAGVIRFMIILVVSHFVWKFTVLGDDDASQVTFFGADISAPFVWMSEHVASVVYMFSKWFGYEVERVGDNIVRFANGNGSRIVWSCTGIKQAYIFFCIILFSRGPWKHKIWFIPLGILVCYVVNIIRITGLNLIVYNHREWFDFLHEHLFKYIYYGILFLLWMWWEEKFALPLRKKDTAKS
ncbi:MAG TPA: archaeosortase/exosortase family protein [Paludibacteraceae bacterium]|jgi:exosortase/archaeosortase family protein|nr:archaeosortase/exosortase family protein [Paludibacteraceae bacterium]HQB68646.1 archaeosortase/exosortase family protein [Paludibacteraceae bacterium]HRS68093.1 archaeosortase/exosortase family protein [Paludibacteraceae bacterium]